jgi:hypothetical protein
MMLSDRAGSLTLLPPGLPQHVGNVRFGAFPYDRRAINQNAERTRLSASRSRA